MSISLFLIVIAIVLFGLAAIGIPSPPRFQFLAAGLFFWALATLVNGIKL